MDPWEVSPRRGSNYPKEHSGHAKGRVKRRVGDALGLSQFGVNFVRLPPGAWSSQRHWHSAEDEFVYVLEGELTLVTDEGERVLTAGMVAGFPAGTPDGHHLINHSDNEAAYLEVGTRAQADVCEYSDIDMRAVKGDGSHRYEHKDGTPY